MIRLRLLKRLAIQFTRHEGRRSTPPTCCRGTCEHEVDWWVLVSSEVLIGFLGFTSDKIEALFIDPDYQRQGGGKFLVAHAQSLSAGTLAVDVNEQNEAALRFYMLLGFSVAGRSPKDADGRPFPILHMKRAMVDDAVSI